MPAGQARRPAASQEEQPSGGELLEKVILLLTVKGQLQQHIGRRRGCSIGPWAAWLSDPCWNLTRNISKCHFVSMDGNGACLEAEGWLHLHALLQAWAVPPLPRLTCTAS